MVDQSEEGRRGRGQPTKYRAEYVQRARDMCRYGARDEDLASEFEVTIQTIHNWRLIYKDFFEATKVAKAYADEMVERALYRKALGYSYDSVKIMTVSVGDGCSTIEQVPFTAHVPPDTGAMAFWLKNRRPSKWRDRQPDDPSDAKLTIVVENGSGGERPKDDEQ